MRYVANFGSAGSVEGPCSCACRLSLCVVTAAVTVTVTVTFTIVSHLAGNVRERARTCFQATLELFDSEMRGDAGLKRIRTDGRQQ